MRLLVLACLALFATDAHAQIRATLSANTSGSTNARYTLTGATTTTAISGNNGTSSTILTSESPNSILYQLRFREGRDRPCYVRAGFWSAPNGWPINGSTSDNFSGRLWRQCSGGVYSPQTVSAQFPPGESSGLGGTAAIHGIQVCTNDRNDNNIRVKGVKILVSMMNQDGQGRIVRSGSYAESFERPNCRKWEQVRRCPQGQVATGLQIFHRGGDNMTGLALKCRQVTVSPL